MVDIDLEDGQTAMHILMLTDLPPYDGGSGYSGAELHNGLISRGHQVTLVVPLHSDRRHGEEGDWIDGNPIYVALQTARNARLLTREGAPVYWNAILGALDNRAPQIVVTNSAGFAPMGKEVAAKFGIPHVAVVRGHPVWKLSCGDSVTAYGLTEVVEALRSATAVVSVSEWLSEELQRTTGIRSRVIKNAPVVNVPDVTPAFNEREYNVLYVGSLSKRKRPEDVLDLCDLAAMEFGHLDVTIIGRGPLHDTIESRFGSGDNGVEVRLLGFLPRAQALSCMGTHRVLILPSESEGDPRVVHEAAEWGTPTLVPQCHWSRELSGGIIQYRDLTQGGRLLGELLATPRRWEQLSHEAVLQASRRRPEEVFAEYEQLILDVCHA